MTSRTLARTPLGSFRAVAASLLTVASVLPSFGCIMIAGGQLADIEVPAPKSPPPAIEQTVGDFSFHLDGGKLVTSNKAGRDVNRLVLDRWKRRGLITRETYVESSRFTGAADYNLTLSGRQNGESSVAMQVLSGLTLYIIPYWVETQLDVVYTLEHVASGRKFEAKAADGFTSITELLFLPISPFALGGMTKTYNRLGDHIYLQLSEQGAFDPQVLAVEPIRDPAARPEGERRASPAERLRLLEDLRSKGLVTDSEYEKKKEEILRDL